MGTGGDVAALARDLPAVAALGRVLRRVVRRRFPLPSLSDAQVGVLRTVEAVPGIGVGAVAERLQVAPNTVSTLVRELVDAGLVVRERDERDRRAARLHLTPAAVEGLALWGSVRDELLGQALLRLDEADRDALARALPAVHRLLAVLDEVDGAHASASRSGTTTGEPDAGSWTTAASTP